MPAWVPWLLAGVAGSAVAAVWGLRRRATRAHRPRRGDIWWADIPFADGSGSKVRPCLVLRGGFRGITVLKITSQDKSRRRDHVSIPTRSWDPHARHDSYLNLGELFVVPPQAFHRRAGACDPAVMREVRRKPWKRATKPRPGGTAKRRR
jgi:mRNA-degrading endonuclease toxin of MazEF toxin-antitoxin module